MAALAHAPDLEIARPRRATSPIQIGHLMGRVLQVPSPAGPGTVPIHHRDAGGQAVEPLTHQATFHHHLGRLQNRALQGQDQRQNDRYSRSLVADKGNVERIAQGRIHLEAALRVRSGSPIPGLHIGPGQRATRGRIQHLTGDLLGLRPRQRR